MLIGDELPKLPRAPSVYSPTALAAKSAGHMIASPFNHFEYSV